MPNDLAKRSIFRVDTPLINASSINAIDACSERFISVIKKGMYSSLLSFGMKRYTVPSRVSIRRTLVPEKYVFRGRFYDHEGLFPAMDSLQRYIRDYGCPVSLYLDKHSTYKTTRQPDLDKLLRGEETQTQFERAAKELDIEIIHANSPQAKGRIERTFGTLQDRLVKELRLNGVCTQEEANMLLEKFIPQYNKCFSKMALKEGNLHRRLPKGIKFRDILCIKAKRTITNDYTLRWRGRRFLIDKPSLAMRRGKVEVREHFDGQITVKFNGHYLEVHKVFEAKSIQTRQTKKPINGKKKIGKIPKLKFLRC